MNKIAISCTVFTTIYACTREPVVQLVSEILNITREGL